MFYKYVIYSLFLFSGATGLVYEVLWHRKLTLIFGSTVYAASTVLTVFFSGLALGAFLIGRWTDRGRDPVKTYAALEGLIGLFGVLSPLLFWLIDRVYLIVVPYVGGGLAGLTAARFVLAYVCLLLPTTLMGATLPVLVRFMSGFGGSVYFGAGRLYAVNTVGAAVGAFLAAIVVVPLFGVDESVALTGVVNLCIGLTAFAAFRSRWERVSGTLAGGRHGHSIWQKYVIALFCGAGFVSMVYQVAWFRVLSQINGSSVYAFGLMLSIFIVGIGVGSEVATRLLKRIGSAVVALVCVELAASLYTLLLARYYDRLPLLYTYLGGVAGLGQFGGSFVISAAIISAMLLFPTLMFGAAFPLVASVYAREASSSGGDVGAVYALNTVGGVLGSFAGGFLLLPYFGAQVTVVSMGVAGLVLSLCLALMMREKAGKVVVAAVCVCATVAVLVWYVPWNVRLMDSAPYINHYGSVGEHLESKGNARLMYYKEGVNVNVSVFGDYEARSISINGKTMATTALTDKSNQYLLGHLPMLLHPNPKSSLVIGLGGGMTFSALVRHGEPSDVVEISPEVVGGARLFAGHNHRVLDQPNAHVIFDDGRNYLKTTAKKYDVITEDPLDPFFMGSGYLYNVEHFRNARNALNPGGIMCQYLPLYQVGVDEAKIIIGSFHAVFPHVTAWFSFNDMLLIGSDRPLRVDVENLRARMSRPEVASDLREIGIDNVYDFLSNYLFDESRIPEAVGVSPLNTDDYPVIEYMTPKALFRDTQKENVLYFSALRENVFPGILVFRDPSERDGFYSLLSRYYLARTHIIRSHLYALYDRYDKVLPELSEASKAAGAHEFGTFYLADIYARIGNWFLTQGRNGEAVSMFAAAAGYRGDYLDIMNPYAEALFKAGKRQEGLALLERSVALEPRQILARFNLAQMYLMTKDYGRANEMIDYCLGADPDDADFLVVKAQVEFSINNKKAGSFFVARALKLKPGNARALWLQKAML